MISLSNVGFETLEDVFLASIFEDKLLSASCFISKLLFLLSSVPTLVSTSFSEFEFKLLLTFAPSKLLILTASLSSCILEFWEESVISLLLSCDSISSCKLVCSFCSLFPVSSFLSKISPKSFEYSSFICSSNGFIPSLNPLYIPTAPLPTLAIPFTALPIILDIPWLACAIVLNAELIPVIVFHPPLIPQSIPKILSTIFGPSITAKDAPINNTIWTTPLLDSVDQALNNKYNFNKTEITNKTTKLDTIHLIISLFFCPVLMSATEYKIPNNFINPSSNIILAIFIDVINKVNVIHPIEMAIVQNLKL